MGISTFQIKRSFYRRPNINVRSRLSQENLVSQRLQRRRALIPASGFFEWKREGTTKIPILLE